MEGEKPSDFRPAGAWRMTAGACPDGGARQYTQGLTFSPRFPSLDGAPAIPLGWFGKDKIDGDIEAYRSRTTADETEDSEELV